MVNRSSVLWWKATSSTLKGILAFIGLVLGVSPLFVPVVRDFLREWWILGWALALTFFLSSAVLFVWNRSLRGAVVIVNRNEVISDLATVNEWLEPFMSNGDIRARLESLLDLKYFSSDLCEAFHKLGRHFNDSSKELFTQELNVAVGNVKKAYKDYWSILDPLLDGPSEIQNSRWDLRVMIPPGGNWSGENSEEQWKSFYKFVNGLDPLICTFLEKVAVVEKTARRLKVQIGVVAEYPAK